MLRACEAASVYIAVCALAAAPGAGVYVAMRYGEGPIAELPRLWALTAALGAGLIALLMAAPTAVFVRIAHRRRWPLRIAAPLFGGGAALLGCAALYGLEMFEPEAAESAALGASLLAGGLLGGLAYAWAPRRRPLSR